MVGPGDNGEFDRPIVLAGRRAHQLTQLSFRLQYVSSVSLTGTVNCVFRSHIGMYE